MAYLKPPSNPRVVPIMAQRKSASAGPASRKYSPEDRAMKKHLEMAMAGMPTKDSLKLKCLDYFKLYAMPVLGDGNCLFYSLSDQLYGNVESHIKIRARLVQHMRDNADYFIHFTADVGGERRAPRRSAAKAARLGYANVDRVATAEGQANKFSLQLNEMEGKNSWGGAPEIQAFCQVYGLDVLLYSKDGVQRFQSSFAEADANREAIHLAFHTFQHYSSVRNLDGPHFGDPKLSARLRGADLIYREAQHKNPNLDKEIKSETVPKEFPSSPTVNPADIHWMIALVGREDVPAEDDGSFSTVVEECNPKLPATRNKPVENESQNESRSSPKSPIPYATTNPPLPARNSGYYSKSSTMSPSSGVGWDSSSRSSSRHSVRSKRSANDSDLDDEDGIILPPTRRCRGRCPKRRMLEDVTVDILGDQSEVFALGTNNANDNDDNGLKKCNYPNRSNDHYDDKTRNDDVNTERVSFRHYTGIRTRTLSAEPLVREHHIKQNQTNGTVVKSIEKDDNDRDSNLGSDGTLSPSVSQGSESTNFKDDDTDDEDDSSDGDDDNDSDYKDDDE
ncbi:hypothetical protein ACJ73_09280 [Blastomyces percursus]|uniref:OTU domain-containing protein n=1 Tax=Blastomyces percursus TaxID=1658174 RepID=A0A1J9QAE1_9EURO|nr:hypothetical protein ACJ73_09280 [Blastomyces percursus]